MLHPGGPGRPAAARARPRGRRRPRRPSSTPVGEVAGERQVEQRGASPPCPGTRAATSVRWYHIGLVGDGGVLGVHHRHPAGRDERGHPLRGLVGRHRPPHRATPARGRPGTPTGPRRRAGASTRRRRARRACRRRRAPAAPRRRGRDDVRGGGQQRAQRVPDGERPPEAELRPLAQPPRRVRRGAAPTLPADRVDQRAAQGRLAREPCRTSASGRGRRRRGPRPRPPPPRTRRRPSRRGQVREVVRPSRRATGRPGSRRRSRRPSDDRVGEDVGDAAPGRGRRGPRPRRASRAPAVHRVRATRAPGRGRRAACAAARARAGRARARGSARRRRRAA